MGSCNSSYSILAVICFILLVINVTAGQNSKGTFNFDLDFLKKYKDVHVLKSANEESQVLVIGDYQGRVMTSTSQGMEGRSYGWINYDLISSGKFQNHINAFGGEDRFWMGPEGGQFSIFFKKGSEFTFENWQTPESIDIKPFQNTGGNDKSVSFYQTMQLSNYQEYDFKIEVFREITLLEKTVVEKNLNVSIPEELSFVGFQSKNKIVNISGTTWKRENGLLSIWILGMFKPTNQTSIIVPYRDSLEMQNYFSQLDTDRLNIDREGKMLIMKGDGKYRSKIGLSPKCAIPILGSYDAVNQVLTIIEYTLDFANASYVNSKWEYQTHPYKGDVINAYNDGPLSNGKQLGPFYELESSSASRELRPGDSIQHIHKTYHFEGNFDLLNNLARSVFGIDLKTIR